MLLTQCAVCATDLGLTLGKKCGRCSTRYCGPECQKQHWEEGGHDQLCKKIKKAGGAEQYNANTKYTEAVAVAAEKCADDTKGQTCYICTQALHWKTKEGLVRMCACRGTAGFAHVSCLAEQAKILVAEAWENHKDSQWHRWHTCSLCEQDYHGVVACAIGWACWKTYLGRPETDQTRGMAMSVLGLGLAGAGHHEDELSVREAELSMKRRLGADEDGMLVAQSNLASTYDALGRHQDSLRMSRDVYFGMLKLHGEEHFDSLTEAHNYTSSLLCLRYFKEAKELMRKTIPVAQRVLGASHDLTLTLRTNYAHTLIRDDSSTLDDLREAVTTLEEAEQTARRVLGGAYPTTGVIERSLRKARAALSARDGSSLSEAFAAMTPSPRV